jgi:hypothetical protein
VIIITLIWLFILPLIYPVFSQEVPTISPPPTTPPDYSKIKINEIFPNPDGSGEWVELINTGSVDIYLDSWYIRDNTQSNKITIENYSITSQSYYVVEFSRDILNNTSPDSVLLFDKTNQQIDQVSYQSTIKALSISNYQNSWCFTLPSPNQNNNPCYSPTLPPTPTSIPTNTPFPTPTAISLPTPTPTFPPPTSTPSPTKTTTSPTSQLTPTITPTSTAPPTRSPPNYSNSSENNLPTSQDIGEIKGDFDQPQASASFDKMTWFPLVLIFIGTFLLLIPLLISKLKHDPDSS